MVVDRSPSQNFGDRTRETNEARDALVDRLKQIKGLEVRVVEAGQADGETDGTKLFSAVTSALSDVPTDRVAGAFLITDGRVHDIPANAAAVGFNAPVHALVTGRSNERDRRKPPANDVLSRDTAAGVRPIRRDRGAHERRRPAMVPAKRQAWATPCPEVGVSPTCFARIRRRIRASG